METTKITVKICEPLLHSFSKKINSCFIKRDSFLNHVLKKEIPRLAKSMKDLEQTNKARAYISGELKRLGITPVNIVVDKDLANELNIIVKKSNISRDAFINRLILLLNADYKILRILGLPIEMNSNEYDYVKNIEPSPLTGIASMMEDPLFYLHHAMEEYSGGDLYKVDLPEKFIGMSCYLDNSSISGSEEFFEMQEFFKDINLTLGKGDGNVQ